jgi:transcription elongation factor Elf1
MSENTPITLGGGKKSPVTNNAPMTDSDGQVVPSEFADNEFMVPTDDVALPSGGMFYPNKQSSVRVKYLTADDENILTSPDLIRSGKVLDVLLENSIIDKGLSPDVMLTGDRNAVLLSLRSTGYGDDYPVNMTCPKCGHEYEQSVKLSELKHKKLETQPDANGEFEVELPKMKAKLKFRLLNGKDESYLTKASQKSKKVKTNIQFSTLLTERYLLQIMEFNGNRDKGYIKKAISSMPVFDSLYLREYMRDVEPGVDLEIEFNCPSCGEVYDDTVPVTARLFWPNAKI